LPKEEGIKAMIKKTILGRSGLAVTELGVGGIPLITCGVEEAADLIRYCVARGLTFFDTANMYADSELKMGRALAPVRDQVVIATKTGARDRATAAEHLAKSLRDLQTDHIDLYQVHNLSTEEHLEQILAPGSVYAFLEEAKKEGRIGHIGVTSHNPTVALKAIRTGLFETLQFPFNFVETEPVEELFPAARELGLGLIGMKPLGGGILERAELCFRFLQEYPDLVPIPGIKAREEIDQILSLYEDRRPLSGAEREEIKAIQAELGERFCHRCGYCMPCPEGIDIPMVFLFKAQTKRFPVKQVLETSKERMEKAEGCQECGQCVEKCPYDLPIPEMIQETLDHYREFCRQQQ